MIKTQYIRSLLCMLLILPIAVAASPSFISVIDAGSSGTRLYIYQYESISPSNTETLPQLTEIFQKKVKPSLASFVNNPDSAAKQIADLVIDGDNFIQQSGGNPIDTPVYLYGTAGMRELPDDQQTVIYNAITNALPLHSNATVKTIPGWEEGIFSWLSANYANASLTVNQKGIVELGGASTQIAFINTTRSENNYQFSLSGKKYQLFSMSFLNLGQDQALMHLKEFGDTTVCYPTGYIGPEGKGDYDFKACFSAVKKEVASFDIPNTLPTSVRFKSFFGLSGFYYNYDFFKANTVVELLNKMNELCGKNDWQGMKALYPDVSENYLSSYCFNASLIANLLSSQEGYSMLPFLKNPKMKSEINGYTLNWSLGAALYAVSGSGLENY